MEIITQRLIIRPPLASDILAAHEVFSDPIVMRYYPHPFTLTETTQWVQAGIESYQTAGIGLWSVYLQSTGKLIGDCGFSEQFIDEHAVMELGYHIRREYWQQGYAYEACTAMLHYAANTLQLQTIVSIIDPHNTASIRTAQKNGMLYYKKYFIFDKWHDIYWCQI